MQFTSDAMNMVFILLVWRLRRSAVKSLKSRPTSESQALEVLIVICAPRKTSVRRVNEKA